MKSKVDCMIASIAFVIIICYLSHQCFCKILLDTLICDNKEPASSERATVASSVNNLLLSTLCSERRAIAISKMKGYNTSNSTAKVTLYLSAIGPLLGQNHFDGAQMYVSIIGSQDISLRSINSSGMEFELTDSTISFPNECGEFFLVAILNISENGKHSSSFSAHPVQKECSDQQNNGLDMKFEIRQTTTDPQIILTNGRIMAEGITLALLNAGNVSLSSRIPLSAGTVTAFLIDNHLGAQIQTQVKIQNLTLQEASDLAIQKIRPSRNDLLMNGMILSGLEDVMLSQDPNVGTDVTPGREIPVDLSRIQFPSKGLGCRGNQHQRDAALFLIFDFFGKIPDVNRTNEIIVLPLSINCDIDEDGTKAGNVEDERRRRDQSEKDCLVVPNVIDDQNQENIVIIHKQYGRSYIYNVEHNSFRRASAVEYKKALQTSLQIEEKTRILSSLSQCPDAPTDDVKEEFLNNSVLTEVQSLISKISQGIQKIDTNQSLAAEEDKKNILTLLLLERDLIGSFLEGDDRLRQFLLEFTMEVLGARDWLLHSILLHGPGTFYQMYSPGIFYQTNGSGMKSGYGIHSSNRGRSYYGDYDKQFNFNEVLTGRESMNCQNQKTCNRGNDETLNSQSFQQRNSQRRTNEFDLKPTNEANIGINTRSMGGDSMAPSGIPGMDSSVIGSTSGINRMRPTGDRFPVRSDGMANMERKPENGQLFDASDTNTQQMSRNGQVDSRPRIQKRQAENKKFQNESYSAYNLNPFNSSSKTSQLFNKYFSGGSANQTNTLKDTIFSIFEFDKSNSTASGNPWTQIFRNIVKSFSGFMGQQNEKRQRSEKIRNGIYSSGFNLPYHTTKSSRYGNRWGFGPSLRYSPSKGLTEAMDKFLLRLMMASSSKDMPEFSFIPSTLLDRMIEFSKSGFDMSKFRFTEPWIVYMMNSMLKSNDSIYTMMSSTLQNLTAQVNMNTYELNSSFTTQLKEVLSFYRTNVSENVRKFVMNDTDLLGLLNFSLGLIDVGQDVLDEAVEIFNKVMSKIASSPMEITSLLEKSPGKDPTLLQNCRRAAESFVKTNTKINSKIDDSPFYDYTDLFPIRKKTNSPITWLSSTAGIYKGERNQFLGVMLWQKIAMCSCSGQRKPVIFDGYGNSYNRGNYKGNQRQFSSINRKNFGIRGTGGRRRKSRRRYQENQNVRGNQRQADEKQPYYQTRDESQANLKNFRFTKFNLARDSQERVNDLLEQRSLNIFQNNRELSDSQGNEKFRGLSPSHREFQQMLEDEELPEHNNKIYGDFSESKEDNIKNPDFDFSFLESEDDDITELEDDDITELEDDDITELEDDDITELEDDDDEFFPFGLGELNDNEDDSDFDDDDINDNDEFDDEDDDFIPFSLGDLNTGEDDDDLDEFDLSVDEDHERVSDDEEDDLMNESSSNQPTHFEPSLSPDKNIFREITFPKMSASVNRFLRDFSFQGRSLNQRNRERSTIRMIGITKIRNRTSIITSGLVAVELPRNRRPINRNQRRNGRLGQQREIGTVCDTNWRDIEASVVCNSFTKRYRREVKMAKVLNGDKGLKDFIEQLDQEKILPPIMLDEVQCSNGDQDLVFECLNSGWGNHNCSAFQRVGVECTFE